MLMQQRGHTCSVIRVFGDASVHDKMSTLFVVLWNENKEKQQKTLEDEKTYLLSYTGAYDGFRISTKDS